MNKTQTKITLVRGGSSLEAFKEAFLDSILISSSGPPPQGGKEKNRIARPLAPWLAASLFLFPQAPGGEESFCVPSGAGREHPLPWLRGISRDAQSRLPKPREGFWGFGRCSVGLADLFFVPLRRGALYARRRAACPEFSP